MTHGIIWCTHCGQPHDLNQKFCVATGKPLETRIHRNSSTALPNQKASEHRRGILGTVIDGKYRIVGRLGSGGLGEVFEAENLRLGRRVAIKMVGSMTKEAVSRLRREARALASFHHPNIRDIYDVGKLPDGQPYLVLERLTGETLHEKLVRSRRLPIADALDVFQQLLSGLHAAHLSGIVHRDLKPANVFLVERAHCAPLVKLLDFGFARDLSGQRWRRITAVGKTCGTPQYMSPEQLRGEEVGIRSDLFSVGVVLFEALVGTHPFEDTNVATVSAKILREPSPNPRSLRPRIPAVLDEIVMRALRKEPLQRFDTALRMQMALAAVTMDDEEGVPSSTSEPLPRLESSPPSSTVT